MSENNLYEQMIENAWDFLSEDLCPYVPNSYRTLNSKEWSILYKLTERMGILVRDNFNYFVAYERRGSFTYAYIKAVELHLGTELLRVGATVIGRKDKFGKTGDIPERGREIAFARAVKSMPVVEFTPKPCPEMNPESVMKYFGSESGRTPLEIKETAEIIYLGASGSSRAIPEEYDTALEVARLEGEGGDGSAHRMVRNG